MHACMHTYIPIYSNPFTLVFTVLRAAFLGRTAVVFVVFFFFFVVPGKRRRRVGIVGTLLNECIQYGGGERRIIIDGWCIMIAMLCCGMNETDQHFVATFFSLLTALFPTPLRETFPLGAFVGQGHFVHQRLEKRKKNMWLVAPG